MNLLPEEEILSNNEILGLTLSSHRIRSQTDSFNTNFMTSIMLENVASISVARFTNPWLIAMGFFSIFIGFLSANNSSTSLGIFLLIGLCLFIAYFLSIKKVIEIASSGGAVIRKPISVDTNMKQVHQLIDKIEDAKDARYMIGKEN
ncbi:MAG: hypothetical protein ACK5ZE_21305 [Pseudanabaena sp.]|jgi:hypothetical protein